MRRNKPVIGITSSASNFNGQDSVMVSSNYGESIIRAGGIPIILPIADEEMAKHWVNLCNGFIFSGGEDVDPVFYHEEPLPKLNKTKPERDQFEISMAQNAIIQKLPILAICRGVHILNTALGGQIIQDIESSVPNCIQHTQKASRETPTHTIKIEEDSFLFSSLGVNEIRVNSLHHQAIRTVASDLKVTAQSCDGIIEAVERMNKEDSLIIGVQWHPEDMRNDLRMQRLFTNFINVCQASKNL